MGLRQSGLDSTVTPRPSGCPAYLGRRGGSADSPPDDGTGPANRARGRAPKPAARDARAAAPRAGRGSLLDPVGNYARAFLPLPRGAATGIPAAHWGHESGG